MHIDTYRHINVYLKQCCLSIYFVNLRGYHNKSEILKMIMIIQWEKVSLCVGNICVIEKHRHIHGIVPRDSF